MGDINREYMVLSTKIFNSLLTRQNIFVITVQEMSPELKSQQTILQEPLNFKGFAERPEYIEVNRELIRRFLSNLPRRFTHVDVAAGTGMVPKLIIETSNSDHKEGRIIGVDPNRTSLDIARETTHSANGFSVEFIEGSGQDLKKILAGKIPEEGADSTSIHDAIHEVESSEDKKIIIHNMADILREGGFLTYNSAFTTRAMERAAMQWGQWKLKALSMLNRKRDKTVTPIEVLKPEEYRGMIEKAGLTVIHEEFRVVNLSKAALAAISRYPKFVEGVCADMVDTARVTVEEKSQALIAALDALNIQGLQRTWHEIIAQKPPRKPQLIGTKFS